MRHHILTYKARVLSGAAGLMLLIGLFFAPAANALNIGGPSDCDNNAIMNCGAHSTGEVINKYNGSAYIRAVYAYFGISNGDISSLGNTNVAGRVTKSGNVFVDGQSRAVATGAITGGRQPMPGSNKVTSQGATFYVRPPSVSFQQDSLPAFVSMKNGVFQFAIIASCGNAVKATPTQPPSTPAAVSPAKPVQQPQAKQQPKPAPPAPAPTQTQSQQQQQQVNVTSTNNNVNTQITNQKTVPQSQPPAQTTQPQAAETVSASQPAQQTSTQPTSLVNTGPTGALGVFLAAVAAGTLAYRRLLVRRLARQQIEPYQEQ